MVEETRLSRWSRLKKVKTSTKTKSPDEDLEKVMPLAGVPEDGNLPAEVEADEEPKEELAPEDLPDPDTLDKDSDFSVFLGDKVPEAIKRKAMSALWRSDPILANLDGLNDYDEDYTGLGLVQEAVKTAYQVGKGYATEEDDVEGDEEKGDGDAVAATPSPESIDDGTTTTETAENEENRREPSPPDDVDHSA